MVNTTIGRIEMAGTIQMIITTRKLIRLTFIVAVIVAAFVYRSEYQRQCEALHQAWRYAYHLDRGLLLANYFRKQGWQARVYVDDTGAIANCWKPVNGDETTEYMVTYGERNGNWWKWGN